MSVPQLTKTVHHAVYPAIDPSNPKLSAAGKTVIITGGTGGIGYAFAQGFCIAGAARVIITARRQEALDEVVVRLNAENATANRQTEIWPYLLDNKDASAAEQVFHSIRARLNQHTSTANNPIDADILITNAASLIQGKTSLEFTPDTYQEIFATNVAGNTNIVRAFLAPELPFIPFTSFDGIVKPLPSTPFSPTNKKTILDVSSFATYTHFPGQAIYAASKLAFTRIMHSLQIEVDQLPGQPIRIHSFNPGSVFTPGLAKLMDEEKVKQFQFDDLSLPRGFAVWLASEEAAFLRGSFVLSGWDVGELVGMKEGFERGELGTITLRQ